MKSAPFLAARKQTARTRQRRGGPQDASLGVMRLEADQGLRELESQNRLSKFTQPVTCRLSPAPAHSTCSGELLSGLKHCEAGGLPPGPIRFPSPPLYHSFLALICLITCSLIGSDDRKHTCGISDFCQL